MKINERQRRFVDFYIQTANASEAARLAGYAGRTARITGAKLLSKTNIAAAIKERLKELEDERIIKTEKVLEHLSSVILGEMTETVVTQSGKKFVVPVKENDRLKACEMILKVRGLFRDKVDVKVDSMAQFISSLEKVWTDNAGESSQEIQG